MKLLIQLQLVTYIMILSQPVHARALRVATFNVSMEATNYLGTGEQASGLELFEQLQTGKNLQIRNIAEIIQRVRPDIILLNEFDYNANVNKGLKAFITRYLNVALHDHPLAVASPPKPSTKSHSPLGSPCPPCRALGAPCPSPMDLMSIFPNIRPVAPIHRSFCVV